MGFGASGLGDSGSVANAIDAMISTCRDRVTKRTVLGHSIGDDPATQAPEHPFRVLKERL